ncbi:hypothetical protein ACFJIV_14480 [Mucilaginibacter sp. UC70_90]
MSKIFFLRSLSLSFIFICIAICTNAQGSNQGTEFYTAYIDHVDGAAGNPDALGRGSQMELYITADANTSVTVEVADGSFSGTYQVKANDILTVDIPPGAFYWEPGTVFKGHPYNFAQTHRGLRAYFCAKCIRGDPFAAGKYPG